MNKLIFTLFLSLIFNVGYSQNYVYWTDFISANINRAELDGSNIESVISNENTPRGIDLDRENGKLFFADGQGKTIKSSNLDGSDLQVLIILAEPIDVQADPEKQVVYFTDSFIGSIGVMNYDGSGVTDIHTGLNKPQSLLLDHENDLLYWNDVDEGIMVSGIDGSNKRTIVNTNTYIRAIDIHHKTGKIYWTDRTMEMVRRANLDGTDIEDMAFGDTKLSALKVDNVNNKVYWGEADNGLIRRMNVDGTAREAFMNGTSGISGIGLFIEEVKVATAPLSDIYWTDSGTNDIRKISEGTTDVQIINDFENTPRGIAVDNNIGKAFYADGSDKTIKSMNLDGSDVTVLYDQADEPIDVALDVENGKVYFSDNIDNSIKRMNYDGSDVEAVLTNLRSPAGIVLDFGAKKIYWNDFQFFTIRRANFDGTDEENLFTASYSGRNIAIDFINDNIYWDNRDDAVIHQRALSGGVVRTIATADTRTAGLSVDAKNNRIYWAENNNKVIKSADLQGDDVSTVAFDTESVGGIALAIPNISSTNSLSDLGVVEIVPNPAIDFVNLNVTFADGNLAVVDNLGRTLSTEKLSIGSNKIDLTNLETGVYFFRISSEKNQEVVKKVVVGKK